MNKSLTKRDNEILKHYRKFWGTPVAIGDFNVQDMITPNPIFIAEFPSNSEKEDWVYATIGISSQDLPNSVIHKAIPRLEFFVYSRRKNSQISRFLAGIASYPFVNQTFFSVGDTVRGNEAILDGSGLSDILVTYPYFEPIDFNIIHHSDKTHTSLIWIIPIYPSEHQFIRDHGWEALEDLFRKYETDTSDFDRKPIL